MDQNITILPADTYKVFNKAFETSFDRDILVSLYQPIIGVGAINLYFTLINSLPNNIIESELYTHHHLMNLMMTDLDSILRFRKKLEAIGLIKTFYKKENNEYLYVLYAPIKPNEFLNHPILNIVLYNNLGKNEYEKVVEKYRTKRLNIKEYEDITTSFDEVFQSVNGYSYENDDIIDAKTRKIRIKSNIDLNLIISGIPRTMASDKCFTRDTMNLIVYLAYIYRIDNLNMQGLIRQSINEKGLINETELRKSCRNFYQFENNGKLPTLIYSTQPEYLKEPEGGENNIDKMVYTFENVSPYDFLRSSYNGAQPTDREKRLIENLMIDQKLNPGVINVLIDYVLKTNNMKLNKDFIEAIAGQWKRLNVETVREAMEICKKEHKKVKKMANVPTKTKKEMEKGQVPEWFNVDAKASSENIDEFNDILKDFD